MKFVTAAAMRAAEGRALAKNSSSGVSMMDQAGSGLARVVRDMAVLMNLPGSAIRLLAGPGNNGGDALAAALHLKEMGLSPEVWLVHPQERIRGVVRIFFDAMVKENIAWREMVGEKAWPALPQETLAPLIFVDALLGTGARGEPLGDVRRAVEYLNARRPFSLIVAADIPTGMDADTGKMAACSVQADVTVAMGFPKVGMAEPSALESLGSLFMANIGLPEECVAATPDARPDLQWISRADVWKDLPSRPRDSHKGTYGTALLLGGSMHYPGAIVLAAAGAARSGAGLVRVTTVPAAAAAVVARTPEAIVGSNLSADIPLGGMEALLAGPGLGLNPESRRLVARLLHESPCPLVLDADAIAVLEGKPEAVRQCAQPVVLTPHPGELSLLLGKTVAEIQQDRPAAVREAAERTGAIVVLKGAGTLVAQTGQPTWINLNGNPGMACGGSGDVLAGLLAGLLAQKIAPFKAACAAVWLHGAAGDIAALRKTQAAMKAGDIVEALPDAFRQASLR
jgi:NAD(P)H-hydrate epimerase